MTQLLTDQSQSQTSAEELFRLGADDSDDKIQLAHDAESDERIDATLRAAVPPPVLLTSEELASEVSQHRILLFNREASIPVTALLAIGGALLFHLFFAAVFFIAFIIVVRSAPDKPGWSAESDSGGGSGYMIAGTGPVGEPAITGDVLNVLAKAQATTPPPQLDKANFTDAPSPLSQIPAAPPVNLIGTPQTASDLGTFKFTRPPVPQPPSTAAVDVGNITSIANAQKTTINDPRTADVLAGRTGDKRGSTVEGPGTGGGNDDDEPIDIFKPGTGGAGSGKGKGKGTGEGIDRGASGANRNSPQAVFTPMPEFVEQVRFKRPEKAIRFEIMVEADGTVGKVTMTQSCGQTEIDTLYKSAVAKWKFAPAVVAGKPIAKIFEVSFTFGTGG